MQVDRGPQRGHCTGATSEKEGCSAKTNTRHRDERPGNLPASLWTRQEMLNDDINELTLSV